MGTIDSLTGLAGVVVTAGVVTHLTKSLFPTQSATRTKKDKKSRKVQRRIGHPGNFSNVGL